MGMSRFWIVVQILIVIFVVQRPLLKNVNALTSAPPGPDGPPAEVPQMLGRLRTLGIILLAGWSSLTNLPRIEDPRITNRYPNVVTLLPGASAERVEALVTEKLEDALEELTEIKKIES